jgi:hypothetical protein
MIDMEAFLSLKPKTGETPGVGLKTVKSPKKMFDPKESLLKERGLDRFFKERENNATSEGTRLHQALN